MKIPITAKKFDFFVVICQLQNLLLIKGVIILDILEEKRALMKLIGELIHERKAITTLYEAIQKRLLRIEEIEKSISEDTYHNEGTIIPRKEIDQLKFKDNKIKSSFIPYDIISKDICYILKTSGIPMNGSQIHLKITKNLHFNLDYKNLVSNILPRMVNDSNLPIEKAYRGFWQYRQTENKGVNFNDKYSR